MYLFKVELKKQLLEGRKIKSVASEIGVTKEFLSRVFNRKRTCSKLTAYCIIKCLNSDAEIDDYFDCVR